MARVVSLTLFLLSWLLLFSYAASDSAPSIECNQVCTEKIRKAFDHTDDADIVSKIRPQTNKLANLVYYHLYPGVCPVETTICPMETTITKDGIPSNNAEIVNKDSEQKTKGKKRKFSDRDDKTPSTKEKKDSKGKGNVIKRFANTWPLSSMKNIRKSVKNTHRIV